MTNGETADRLTRRATLGKQLEPMSGDGIEEVLRDAVSSSSSLAALKLDRLPLRVVGADASKSRSMGE